MLSLDHSPLMATYPLKPGVHARGLKRLHILRLKPVGNTILPLIGVGKAEADRESLVAGIARTTGMVKPAPGILRTLGECEKAGIGEVLVVDEGEAVGTAATKTLAPDDLVARWNGNWTFRPAC